jgi:activator of 2-hydroxyglutaryl-CoA dehydratase
MVNRTALQPKNMQKYIIGIDTGGTYTDAVLLDKESGKVLATAKKTTTHYQLALGTGEAAPGPTDDPAVPFPSAKSVE